MNNLTGILGIIGIIFFILSLLGLAKPSLVKQKTREKAFFMNFGLSVVFFSISGFLIPADYKSKREMGESQKVSGNTDNSEKYDSQYQCRQGQLTFTVVTEMGPILVAISEYGIVFENNKDNKKFVVAYKHDQTTGKTPVHKLQIGDVILSEKIEPGFVYTAHPQIFSLLNSATQNTTVKATVALGSKQAYSNRTPPYTFQYVSFSFPLHEAMENTSTCGLSIKTASDNTPATYDFIANKCPGIPYAETRYGWGIAITKENKKGDRWYRISDIEICAKGSTAYGPLKPMCSKEVPQSLKDICPNSRLLDY